MTDAPEFLRADEIARLTGVSPARRPPRSANRFFGDALAADRLAIHIPSTRMS
jgi:hypothetical protein